MDGNNILVNNFLYTSPVEVNCNGGLYERGKKYSYAKKMEVAAVFTKLRAEGKSLDAIAKHCGVSRPFVGKIEEELIYYGTILSPDDPRLEQGRSVGAGAKTYSEIEMFVLFQLYLTNPCRSLQSYVDHLLYYTGTPTSTSTVSQWFSTSLPYQANFRAPFLVPLDTFRPNTNAQRAEEFLHMMMRIDPARCKFADEKLLKGAEIWKNRKPRRNGLTGITPCLFTPPDFQTTYAAVGFCGIDTRTKPLHYWIHDGMNTNAEYFVAQIQQALSIGFLRPGDVLVLSNAAIHGGTDLDDWIWENLGIFIIYLPARTSTWNPMKLVWRRLVAECKKVDLNVMNNAGCAHAIAFAAHAVLMQMTHDDILALYRGCPF